MNWEKYGNVTSWIGMAFVAGWISCQSYYGLERLWVQKNALAQTAAQAICDRGKARSAAGALLATDNADDVSGKAAEALKGCPKVSPKSVPQVAAILKK